MYSLELDAGKFVDISKNASLPYKKLASNRELGEPETQSPFLVEFHEKTLALLQLPVSRFLQGGLSGVFVDVLRDGRSNMEILAALGVAFGATYAVAMPLRTVRIRSLFWTTFAITFAAALGCFYYFPLPANYLALIGAVGLVIGCLLTVVQKKATEMERDYDRARKARGEKVLQ